MGAGATEAMADDLIDWRHVNFLWAAVPTRTAVAPLWSCCSCRKPLGTLFAPVQDRRAPGAGFTHEIGDEVRIKEPRLGCLYNRVRLSPDCPPWTFGTTALMRNLASRGLI